MSLAVQLGMVTDRLATFDTDELVEWESFLSMLLVAIDRLQQQQRRAHQQVLAARG
jgi:hypothetical protein